MNGPKLLMKMMKNMRCRRAFFSLANDLVPSGHNIHM